MKLTPVERNNHDHNLDPLDQYLKRGDYERLTERHSSYETICDVVASTDPASIVAVDGPSNGGKTSFTQSLIDFYETQGVPASYIPLDYFLTDRNERSGITQAITEGSMTIDEYSDAAWEQERYRSTLHEAQEIAQNSSDAHELTIPRAYNRQTGAKDESRSITIHPGSVIITEGVGVQAYHSDLFDVTVRVDTYDDDILMARLQARERQKPEGAPRLEDDFLKMRFDTIDAPHTEYLRANSPNPHFVVDTSNFDDMLVYKHR